MFAHIFWTYSMR